MNEHLDEIIKINDLSERRVDAFNTIKEFIDRISTKKYLEQETLGNLKDQFGVLPNIVTWGDYFQTELAASLLMLTDDEFAMALDTLKFDMISSYIIFHGKGKRFFRWILEECDDITEKETADYDEAEEELVHLKILMDYFVNLGLKDNFTPEEMRWYKDFEEARAM